MINIKCFHYILIIVSVILCGLTRAESACTELDPVSDFQEDYFSGKFYWILQAKSLENQDDASCPFTNTFVEGNTWTFIDTTQNKDGTERFLKQVGIMDKPGHWNVSSVLSDGTPFIYSLTCLGGESKKWNVLYSCNSENGKYAMWLFYYKRVPLGEIDESTMQKVNETLTQNGLTFKDSDIVNNENCNCK